MSVFVILPEDRLWLEKRIEELSQQIKDLGEEFHEVLNQSSETWHDNAPFDAVRDKQSLLQAEYGSYREILLKASFNIPVPQPGTVGIGSTVRLVTKAGTTQVVFIAGDWAHNTGSQLPNGALVISRQSPLAQELLGKSAGASTRFGEITAID